MLPWLRSRRAASSTWVTRRSDHLVVAITSPLVGRCQVVAVEACRFRNRAPIPGVPRPCLVARIEQDQRPVGCEREQDPDVRAEWTEFLQPPSKQRDQLTMLGLKLDPIDERATKGRAGLGENVDSID